MSAADALRAAEAFGVRVTVDGESLLLEASAAPPEAVLDALSRHKAAIVSLLRPSARSSPTGTAGPDCNGNVPDSRAMPKATAEAKSFARCVVEWLNQHPAPSPPGRCALCGKSESPSAIVLPFGTELGTHTWLHAECWPAWYRARRAEATRNLRPDSNDA